MAPNTENHCAGCLKEISRKDKSIRCTRVTCNKLFHKDICIGGRAPKDSEIANWICPQCKCESKRGGDNSSTPVRADLQPSASDTADENITYRAKKVQALTVEIHLLREDMSALRKNMDSSTAIMNERFDDVIKRLTASDERVAFLEARYEAENSALTSRVAKLEGELNLQAQRSLRNQMEIIGLPETTNENLHHIVMVAAKKVGVDLKDEQIDWAERSGPARANPTQYKTIQGTVTTKVQHRPVVVCLTRRAVRDELLKAARARNSTTALDVGVGNQPVKLYFNERLTRENRLLFRESRIRSTQAGFKYCWTSNGFINIRRREGSAAIRIRNYEELAGKLGVPVLAGPAVLP